MPKAFQALTITVVILALQMPMPAVRAELPQVSLMGISYEAAWSEAVWPAGHWSLPYAQHLVRAGILTLSEVESLNRRIGPEGLISAGSFETYASRTLKTILPGRFLSSKPITREQTADTLYRMIRYSSFESLPEAAELDQEALIWKDAALFQGFGYQASLAFRWLGILSGNEGKFHPQAQLTVAEALTVLAKTHDRTLRTPFQWHQEASSQGSGLDSELTRLDAASEACPSEGLISELVGQPVLEPGL